MVIVLVQLRNAPDRCFEALRALRELALVPALTPKRIESIPQRPFGHNIDLPGHEILVVLDSFE